MRGTSTHLEMIRDNAFIKLIAFPPFSRLLLYRFPWRMCDV